MSSSQGGGRRQAPTEPTTGSPTIFRFQSHNPRVSPTVTKTAPCPSGLNAEVTNPSKSCITADSGINIAELGGSRYPNSGKSPSGFLGVEGNDIARKLKDVSVTVPAFNADSVACPVGTGLSSKVGPTNLGLPKIVLV